MEGRARRHAATCRRARGRPLQLGGDALVEPGRRLRAVPCPAIGIDARVGRLGERLVDAAAVLRRGRPVHGRSHQRMAKAHLGAELHQPRLRGGRPRGGVDPERGGRLPQQERIADRLGRRDQEQQPRGRRQLRQALLEALLDAAGQHRPAVQAEPARQLGGRAAPRQLQQRERVAVRLGHDAIPDALVERTRHHRLEQHARVLVLQPADDELRQPVEGPLAGRLAHGEDQPDRLRAQPPRHERERLRRGGVEPLRVVDDADQRPLLRHLGQQAQDRQADQEALRSVTVAHAEGRAERSALRTGKALEPIHERRTQLLKPGERELHLRLHARGPHDAAPGGVLHQIPQQRALTDARLPAQHQRPARPRADARHQLIQRRALGAPPEQIACGHGHCRGYLDHQGPRQGPGVLGQRARRSP